MRRFLLLLMLVLASTALFSQKIYQCDTDENAQIRIYPVDDPSEADLLVFFVWEPELITKPGAWMDMPEPHMAEVFILFVDEEEEADIKIWLVDSLEEVRWVNESKRDMLTISRDTGVVRGN